MNVSRAMEGSTSSMEPATPAAAPVRPAKTVKNTTVTVATARIVLIYPMGPVPLGFNLRNIRGVR